MAREPREVTSATGAKRYACPSCGLSYQHGFEAEMCCLGKKRKEHEGTRLEALRLAVSVAPENEHTSWTLERAEAFMKYILEGAV